MNQYIIYESDHGHVLHTEPQSRFTKHIQLI